MKTIILIILFLFAACQKEVAQPDIDYTNHLIIDDTLVTSLFNVRYYKETATIHLKPEYGIIVLKRKHDSIHKGYMVINSIPYHIDSAVCVYTVTDRIKGYSYGKMKRSSCQHPNDYRNFKLKFNLLK